MRILSIDYGQKRIGMAMSDPLGFTAQALPTLEGASLEEGYQKIRAICEEKGVEDCVVGLPYRMNGEVGIQAEKVLAWIEGLKEKLNCSVNTWDERLTSKEADRLMVKQNLSRKKQKQNSDSLSAILILQNYLDYKRYAA